VARNAADGSMSRIFALKIKEKNASSALFSLQTSKEENRVCVLIK